MSGDNPGPRLDESASPESLPPTRTGSTVIDAEVVAGRYTVLGPGKPGGMGVIHRAHDPILDRVVAIKRLRASRIGDEVARRRLLEEARAAARLSHPNIVTIHEFEEAGDEVCIVMEFVEGVDLATAIRRRIPLTFDLRLDILAQVCDGLAYAHAHGVVHRDIKPGNVLLCPDGVVKIVDFGIATLAGGGGPGPSGVAGTPEYLAPEQISGLHAGDIRSDLFSFGVMLYEFISGDRPFHSDSVPGVFFEITNSPHQPLCDRVPGLAPELSALADRLLAKDPLSRPGSAGEVRDQLRQIRSRRAPTAGPSLGETVQDVLVGLQAEVASSPATNGRSVRTWHAAAAGAAVLVSAVGLVVLARQMWFNLRPWGGVLSDPYVVGTCLAVLAVVLAWDYYDDHRVDGGTILRAVSRRRDGRSSRFRVVSAWLVAALPVTGLLLVPLPVRVSLAPGPAESGALEKKYQLSEPDYVVQNESHFVVTTFTGPFNTDGPYEVRVSLRRYGEVEFGSFYIDREYPNSSQPLALALDDGSQSGLFSIKGTRNGFTGRRQIRFTCTYWSHARPPDEIEIEATVFIDGHPVARDVRKYTKDAWTPRS